MSGPIVRLSDYAPCVFHIDRIEMTLELDLECTAVRTRMSVRRTGPADAVLELDGQELQLEGVTLQGRELEVGRYETTPEKLRIFNCPEVFELGIRNRIFPAANTALEGLYASGGLLCTQCEPEGFRRITYFLDRPDNPCLFTVCLVASAATFPRLLSNGHLVDSGTLADGRHFACWEDPFPKPSYLFAVVAGDLVCVEDTFTTVSGRPVTCRVWVEHHNRDRAGHALASLLLAMRWDESTFHRECDLDLYQVVAVDAFNAGAMENKGLNIFNSRYVLASPETATDADYDGILRVIGHEYFHNWSGNRVTLRDWFQLSLKEGLTVFRDQEFTCDTLSRGVKRVADAKLIRTDQFLEDAGPLSHPVRPASYVDINNFYTRTVYEKGAEVIRMMHTWIGADAFVAGLDLYFARHDHGAATVEDLIACLGDASGQDLSLFLRWYDQPGTPILRAKCVLENGEARLSLSQQNPRAPSDAGPLPMPVVVSFVDTDGEVSLIHDPHIECTDASRTFALLKLTRSGQDFVISGIPADATVCWLGGFSAPVILEADDDVASMLRRASRAPDPYNRWDAGSDLMLTLVRQDLEGTTAVFTEYLEAVRAQLDAVEDPAFTAMALAWPRELTLCQSLCPAFPLEGVLASRAGFLRETGRALDATLQEHFVPLHAALPAHWDLETSGRRALKNTLFALWARQCNGQTRALARSWYEHATNMTDRIAALSVLCLEASADRDMALADFFDRFGHDFTMLTTWFSVQAAAAAPDTFDNVKRLVEHPAFDWTNPNKVRAVIRSFAANLGHFHRADGAGYDFVGDAVLRLNEINPQIAAGMVGSFSQTGLLDPARLQRLRGVLESLAGTPGMKDKVLEQLHRILGA